MKYRHLSASQLTLALLLIAALTAAAPAAAQVIGGDVDVYKTKIGESGLDDFGGAVCGPGDLNGDGIPDYVVGAKGAWGRGEIYAFSGADHSELWYGRGEQSTDWYGFSLAAIEDIDGDGVNEVAVSAIYFDNGAATNSGKVYLLSGVDGAELWSYESPTAHRWFGEALAAAGDVNGDGYEDVVAGMRTADSPSYSSAGKITVLDGLDGSFMYDEYGSGTAKYFGTSVAGVGDLDLDGYDDIVVGVPGHDTSSLTNAGRLTILSGRYLSGNGGAHYIEIVDGDKDGGQLGKSVCRVGDINGDGVPEIFAGAPYADSSSYTEAGSALLFYGDNRNLWRRWYGEEDNEGFGMCVSSAGDVDHDGLPDLLVGAPYSGSGSSSEVGMIYTYSGRTKALIFQHEGEEYDGRFGSSVASVGDLNGDGTSEVISGAPDADWNTTDDGYVQILALEPFLTISQFTASVGGDTVTFDVNFPDSSGGLDYQILISATGAGPTVIDGIEVPLTADPQLAKTLAGTYPGFISGFTGTLDAFGEESGTLSRAVFPPGFVGRTPHFAVVTLSGGVVQASSIVQILEFVP